MSGDDATVYNAKKGETWSYSWDTNDGGEPHIIKKSLLFNEDVTSQNHTRVSVYKIDNNENSYIDTSNPVFIWEKFEPRIGGKKRKSRHNKRKSIKRKRNYKKRTVRRVICRR